MRSDTVANFSSREFAGHLIEIIAPDEPRESLSQQGALEQCLRARRHIGAMSFERVPRDDDVIARLELAPEPCRSTLHSGAKVSKSVSASLHFCERTGARRIARHARQR